ncbi:S8 family serine peptidase, partial [Bacillus sp. 7884-1]|uniref:S8 family serine peptidase n=1 Tax=Bacillus sp. 7884-1 TaxID=2021693 RepID=UPI000BA73672
MTKSKLKAFKVMTTAAVTSLILSSFTVFAETNDTSTEPLLTNPEFATSLLENQLSDQEKVTLDQPHKPVDTKYTPNDSVRVIVEMTGEPVHSGKGNEAEKKKLKQAQKSLIQEMKETKKLNVKERHHFVTGINGFSMDTQFKNIKEIEKLDGVARVHIAETYQQMMSSSQSMIQAKKVWEELGYHGEGMVVAVVDTGVDYPHKDLTMSDRGKEKEKWTSTTIKEKLAETEINDGWFTDKVPSGYDWADNDPDVIPWGSAHGTHVSGIIGANGTDEIDGVKGIAPDVQILAEKVFSDNGGGAYADDIIAGINHAVEMDADVINMSLGTDAEFVDEENPIQKAVHTATDQGVLVVCAGGNAYYSTKSGSTAYKNPSYAQNPDIGVISSPGISPFALQVASYENDQIRMDTLTLSDGKKLIYKRYGGRYPLADAFTQNKEIELVYVGYGSTQDFTGKDVKGKIVVAEQRFAGSEQSIQSPALKGGAVGVIVAPLASLGDYGNLLFSQYSIPGASTQVAEGQNLIQRLKNGEKITVQAGQGTWIDNKNKGKMSDFSSWGAPTTLDFKPEITAPGGKIYSTIWENHYAVYSGTSMATPMVVGGGALVLQSLYEKGVTKGSNAVYQAKTALMNTAKVVMDPATDGKIPYSPRKQGSGMMQIANALQTPVLVKDKFAKPENAAAVELKEIKQDKVKFMLLLEALAGKSSPEEITYDVYLDLLTDDTELKDIDINRDGKNDRTMEVLKLMSKRIEGATAKINGKDFSDTTPATFTVKKGHLQDLEVDIKLPDGLKKNIFVEGFVRFVPRNGDQASIPSLTIPYMGFYGNWDEPQNLDAPKWDQNAFLQETALFPNYGQKNWLGKPAIPIGYDNVTKTFSEERMAISPHAANQGLYPQFTTLRNVKKVDMYVEDASGNRVRDLGDFSEFTETGEPWKFRKNVMSNGEFVVWGGYNWNLKSDDGKYVPDGKYQFIIESTLDYKGARPQKVKMPINIDSVAPKVENIQVNKTPENKYLISWDMMDNAGGSGLTKSIVYVDGIYKTISATQSSLLVNAEPKSVIVVPFDWAGNVTYEIYGDRSYLNQYTFLTAWDVWGRPITQQEPGHILGIG